MRTKGSWLRAVTWTFLWWVNALLRGRRAGLLQALLTEITEHHAAQERDELGPLLRGKGRGLRCG